MATEGTIAAIGEAALVDRIRRRAGAPPEWLRVGIGDDAAVYAPDRNAVQVITTDSLVENVHFRSEWTPYASIGYKAVAVNLSDLAAMGAEPRGLLLSLALPATFHTVQFDDLVGGILEAAARVDATLVGGNLSQSPGPAVVDVTAFGSGHPRKILRRSGGRPDDELYVTGELGAAAAGLLLLRRDRRGDAERDLALSECLSRYERPDARVRCGIVVARSRTARAAVDLSDGLASGVRLLAEASGTGAEIDGSQIPVHRGATALAESIGVDALDLAIAGGEDYELLFAVSPARRRAFLAATGHAGRIRVTRIGRLTKDAGTWLVRNGIRVGLEGGFRHF
jgi:thiamine-monophosphate kinase